MTQLYNLFVFLPMLVSFFWAITFLLDSRKKNTARFFLGIFMVVEGMVYLCHGIFFSGNRDEYLIIDAFYNLVGLSSYPMYYIYIRLLSCNTHFKRSHLLYLLPSFVLAATLQICLLLMNHSEKINYFNNAIMLRKYPENASLVVYIASTLFFIIRIVFSFQVFLFLTKSYLLVKKYNNRIQNFYSNTKGKELVWVKTLIISLSIASLMSLVVNIIGRGFFVEEKNFLIFIPSLLFSSLIFFLGLQGYKQNHNVVNFVKDSGDTGCEYDNTSLIYNRKKEAETELLEKLQKTIEEDKVFLDKELKIIKLSEHLQTNRTYLSHLINNEYHMSFNDFINQFRVEYAKKLIDQDSKHTYSLDYISEESGFGSFSSFNRAFKKFEKKTAANYRK